MNDLIWRLNYGNGQISEFSTREAAESEWRAQREYDRRHNQPYGAYTRLQRYAGDGEWVTVAKDPRG